MGNQTLSRIFAFFVLTLFMGVLLSACGSEVIDNGSDTDADAGDSDGGDAGDSDGGDAGDSDGGDAGDSDGGDAGDSDGGDAGDSDGGDAGDNDNGDGDGPTPLPAISDYIACSDELDCPVNGSLCVKFVTFNRSDANGLIELPPRDFHFS